VDFSHEPLREAVRRHQPSRQQPHQTALPGLAFESWPFQVRFGSEADVYPSTMEGSPETIPAISPSHYPASGRLEEPRQHAADSRQFAARRMSAIGRERTMQISRLRFHKHGNPTQLSRRDRGVTLAVLLNEVHRPRCQGTDHERRYQRCLRSPRQTA
jgi:hypothetical protein